MSNFKHLQKNNKKHLSPLAQDGNRCVSYMELAQISLEKGERRLYRQVPLPNPVYGSTLFRIDNVQFWQKFNQFLFAGNFHSSGFHCIKNLIPSIPDSRTPDTERFTLRVELRNSCVRVGTNREAGIVAGVFELLCPA